MPVVKPEIYQAPTDDNVKLIRVVWPNMGDGDIGEPVQLGRYADRSVQVSGTYGTGGKVQFQGSLDADPNTAQWDPAVYDTNGLPMEVSDYKIRQVVPLCLWHRPVVSGDATTNLTVTMFCKIFAWR